MKAQTGIAAAAGERNVNASLVLIAAIIAEMVFWFFAWGVVNAATRRRHRPHD
jgi:hypothetical protein